MQNYVIVHNPLNADARRAARRDGGLRGLRPLGPSTQVTPAALEQAKVEVARLTAGQAATLERDDAIDAVARVMPTRLIAPLDAGPAVDGAGDSDWGIAAVGADVSAYTGDDVIVAILDTGIEAAHPAFAGVDIVEQDFTGSGNGDQNGHGTHCAGTILGRDVGGTRIGVARGIKRALIGRVLGANGGGDSDMIFQAMQWAMTQKAHIVSMSLGFDFPGLVGELVKDNWPIDLATSTALEAYRGNLRVFDSIMGLIHAYAMLGSETLVVAAAGNESRRAENKDYRIAASLPAAADNVVSVAAAARNGAGLDIADFSNSMAVVTGPGVDIRSAWLGGALKTISGTSMACPHVAGVSALWWQKLREDGLAPGAEKVKAQLRATARRTLFAANFDEADYGQGMVTAP